MAERRHPGVGFRVLWSFVLVGGLTQLAGAQLIDRMVAVVDGEVITQSQIDDYRRFGEFFGDTVPEGDAAIRDQLVENALISRRIEQFNLNVVRPSDVDAYLDAFGDPGEIGVQALRAEAGRRIARARYFDSILRSLRATPDEVRMRYENELVPRLEAAGAEEIPPLFEVEAELREIVRIEKLNAEIRTRLDVLHRSYQVEVVE